MKRSGFLLFWCFWLCLYWSGSSWAGFEFISYDAPAMDLSTAAGNNIRYQFSVEFRAECTSGCTGPQNYRLAFSANSIGSGAGNAPAISEGELGPLIKGQVRFSTTGGGGTPASHKTFSPGQWSGHIRVRYGHSVTATFIVKFNRPKLQSLVNSGQSSLRFYVVGEDIESARYHDTLAIKIPLKTQEEVKITGLNEIVLNAGMPSAAYLESGISACVYSSSGRVRFDLDGANVPGQPFQLSQTDRCDSESPCIPYVVRIQNPGQTNGLEYQRRGDQSGILNGSREPGCQHIDNLNLQVRINGQDLSRALAGQYRDVLTITVTPM